MHRKDTIYKQFLLRGGVVNLHRSQMQKQHNIQVAIDLYISFVCQHITRNSDFMD
uniref:Uncharacterized protein n=1 Tax=Ciona savignyi TaxID=51511 RepID=H2ZH76_CIOSA